MTLQTSDAGFKSGDAGIRDGGEFRACCIYTTTQHDKLQRQIDDIILFFVRNMPSTYMYIYKMDIRQYTTRPVSSILLRKRLLLFAYGPPLTANTSLNSRALLAADE